MPAEKFNAKSLHYDKSQPAFLQRLRGEFCGSDGRHNVQIARPKKARLTMGDEDEDAPVVVDESGEVLGKGEWERMRDGEGEKGKEEVGSGEGGEGGKAEEEDGKKNEQKFAAIGAANLKKRKAGKFVGDGEDDDEKDDGKGKATTTETVTKKPGAAKVTQQVPRIKKKGKKIKLSFDEPDEV